MYVQRKSNMQMNTAYVQLFIPNKHVISIANLLNLIIYTAAETQILNITYK